MDFIGFLRKIDSALPSLKYYAATFWWAWNFSGYGGFMWSTNPQLESGHFSTFNIVSTASISLTFLLLANLKSSRRLLNTGSFIVCGGVLGSGGTALLVLLNLGYIDSFVGLLLAGITTGVGSAVLAMRIAEYFGTIPLKESLGFTLKAAAFTMLVYFVIVGSPFVVGLVTFVSLFLIVAALLLVGNYTELPTSKDPRHYINPSPSLRHFLLLVAFSFVIGEAERFSFAGARSVEGLFSMNSVTAVTTLIVLLIGVFAVSMMRKPLSFKLLYYPFTIIILILFSFSIITDWSNGFFFCIVSSAHFIFQTQIFALFATISYSSKSSPLKVFGFGFFAMGVGSTVGALLGRYFVAIESFLPLRFFFAIALLAVFIVLLVFIFPRKEAVRLVLEIPDEEDAVLDKPSFRKSTTWRNRCRMVGAKNGLTPREQEVLELLAKGHGTNYISSKLVISFFTVRAHIRNIYTKIDVHNREALIKAIESYEIDFTEEGEDLSP